MKKVLSLLTVTVMVLTLCFAASAQGGQTQTLSEMSDGELLAFLAGYDVDIPAVFMSEDECLQFVRKVIEKVERNPDVVFLYGSWYLYQFAENIRSAVLAYYGSDMISMTPWIYEEVDSLLYNEVTRAWIASDENYNCYAYATGYSVDAWYEPGQIAREINGESGSGNIMYPNMATLVNYVKDDLLALGYTNISSSTHFFPPVGSMGHDKIICVRRETDVSGDYHFMVLRDDGYWYHKPGESAPLKYLHDPEEMHWVLEALSSQGYRRDTEKVYASDVYYIYYTTDCVRDRYVSLGNGTHIGKCNECGEYIGNATTCTYSYRYSNADMHTRTCSGCGETSRVACVYVNNVCRFCGHYKVSGSIIQSVRSGG